MFFSINTIETFNDTWINILHSFLVVFTNCKLPRTRRKSRKSCIMENVEGFDLEGFEENKDHIAGPIHSLQDENVTDDIARTEFSLSDMQRAISTMSNLFPEATRPTGEESEPFTFRLNQVLEQMDSMMFPKRSRSHILYALLRGKAREAASKVNFAHKDIIFLVDSLKREILHDPDKQDRRVTRWNTITYEEFRGTHSTEEDAVRSCLKHLSEHQLDLPPHLHVESALLDRIKAIFRFIPWCSIVFQRTVSAESAASFGSRIISAASNHDLQSKHNRHNYGKTSVNQTQQAPPTDHSLTTFFSKTPPPPKHRRPQRYRSHYGSRYSQHGYGNPRFRYFASHLSYAMARKYVSAADKKVTTLEIVRESLTIDRGSRI